MRCPEFRNYDVSPGTKHKRGVKSRVKKLSVIRDQNSIFFLELDPIPFLGLDLIDPRSSSFNVPCNFSMTNTMLSKDRLKTSNMLCIEQRN